MEENKNIIVRSIGILTSGGDAPGMNAVVRGVVRAGCAKGLKVYGVKNGYTGLINGEFELMGKRDVSNILHRGGTILGSARSIEMKDTKGQREAIRQLNNVGIDCLIVCGGDGTMTGGNALYEMGFPVIGIPGTIDNDVWGTSTCVGVDTALNTIAEAIDKIRDTAASHTRAYIVQTMGRDCGYLAIQSAIVSGGECVLIPEDPISIEEVAATIENAYRRGKKHCIILMAEGFPMKMDEIVKQLDAMDLGFVARGVDLSYIQRGGSPSAFDRILASRMAFTAVDWAINNQFGVMTALQADKMTPVPLKDVIGKHRQLNLDYMNISNILSR